MMTRIDVKERGLKTGVLMLMAPLAAMIYPFLLQGYSECMHAITSKSAHLGSLTGLMAALFLLTALAVPVVALVFAMKFSRIENPTAADRRARWAALLAVAAPPIFTFVGVLLYMLKDPVPDKWVLVVFWAIVCAAVMRSSNTPAESVVAAPTSFRLRAAHEASALGILVLFLLLHMGNHLVGLAGPHTYAVVLKTVRFVYRSSIVEPIVVGLFLFQVASGLYLVRRPTTGLSDNFGTFQIASGVYLVFFVLGHMNSVFVFARTFLGVDTGWGFATGAPAGLLLDAWNIRLVPHYLLGVFFALTHVLAGARAVLLHRRMRQDQADRLMIAGAGVSGMIAALIILGMCGLRIWNA